MAFTTTIAPLHVPLPRHGTLARIELDMRSRDARVAKGGIQAACEYLEASPARPATRRRIAASLSYQLGAVDPQVLRWGYKAIALLGSGEHQPYLRQQLGGGDLTPENRTWAVAALAGMTNDYRDTVYQVGDEQTLTYDLSAEMYSYTGRIRGNVHKAIDTDDPLNHQWLGLLYGDGRIELPASVLHALTASAHPAVVEYIIWGIRKRALHGASVVAIDPLSLAAQPVNVRRWYCRLVAQSPADRNAYQAQILDWIENEPSSLVREGLARGLHESPKDKHWKDVWHQWREFETDPFVRRALGRRVSAAELALAEPARSSAGRVAQALASHLDVDVALPFLEADPTSFPPDIPFDRAYAVYVQRLEYTVTNFNVSDSNINNLQASGMQISSGTTNQTTANNNAGADAAAVLSTVAGVLRASGNGSAADEAQELADEASGDGGTPPHTRTSFWRRVRGFVEVLRGTNAAIDASQELIDNLDQLTSLLPPGIG
jgi:hypothetical protein